MIYAIVIIIAHKKRKIISIIHTVKRVITNLGYPVTAFYPPKNVADVYYNSFADINCAVFQTLPVQFCMQCTNPTFRD